MAKGLEALADMEYPGRVIIAGKTDFETPFVAYGLTGRSPSSQARRLVYDRCKDVVTIEIADEEQLKQGNQTLLVYDAIVPCQGMMVVSNGAQTKRIVDIMSSYETATGSVMPVQNILSTAMAKPYHMGGNDVTSYEPDDSHTPRISAVLKDDNAFFCIVKKDENENPMRISYSAQLVRGKAKMLCTYDGKDAPKGERLKSFEGDLCDLTIEADSFPKLCEQIYRSLGKYCVSAAVWPGPNSLRTFAEKGPVIINLHDEGE